MKCRLKRLVVLSLASIGLVLVCWTIFDQFDKKDQTRKVALGASKLTATGAKSSLDDITDDEDFSDNLQVASSKQNYRKIDCLINDEYSVGCLKASDNNVFLPFPFLKKYYEVSGKLSKRDDGSEYFNWQHSSSKIFFPREPYDHRGVFLWFDNYNVEVRDRVKYISGIHSVPVTSQWNANGHYYPVQVAQFGLSHFSKNLTLGKPRVLKLEDGSLQQEHWNILNYHSSDVNVKSVKEETLKPDNLVLLIEGNSVVFNVKKKKFSDLHLGFTFKALSNISITVTVQAFETGQDLKVYYTSSDEDIVVQGGVVYYGIGSESIWKTLIRDIGVDLQKSQAILGKKLTAKSRFRITRILFKGKLYLDDVTISSSAHEYQFNVAAKWLVQNQDDKGGWPVQVTRKLSNGELVLKPGWYSAMAQGQAISLLCRMYLASKDSIYLETAIKALNLFYVNSTDNGIRTYFLDRYVWYEEYPTVPSSFVLNGFMYSLFGLFDLKMTCQRRECQRAAALYDDGIKSLKKLIPLFDTGSGSVYDLRHVSLGSAPNLARSDYMAVHINQLMFINTIENDLLLQTTAKRWVSYTKGKRAPHN